ncbi:hypothetical protein N7G274_002611 [Stereocaulon virgatum]|uniref:Uncharacterized protein n=1 Tax=Stereocaulon virgatum TaxID=373712 RepID=A0ABR4AJ43_9LECA
MSGYDVVGFGYLVTLKLAQEEWIVPLNQLYCCIATKHATPMLPLFQSIQRLAKPEKTVSKSVPLINYLARTPRFNALALSDVSTAVASQPPTPTSSHTPSPLLRTTTDRQPSRKPQVLLIM